MKTVSKNARDIYNFRNKIINNIKKETGERIDEKEEMESLDDLLYAGAEKLRQLKNEYDNEDKKFNEDNRVKNGREALKNFTNDILDEKFTKKKLIREYLKKIKPYKDKLKDKQKYAGSNFDKLLGYIERIEFAVFGTQ